MARSQPLHKYALVLGLKSLKNVVAVTGDGTNDAPALSKSDVGFAMFAGTDIAKEASDIVIIDNNFSSIVTAIIYGRNIYDNIRKFLQFQLSVNFCACILVFVCACVGNETPLTPIQMLWVNLIMDSLGSLALATEPPYEELLQREPTKRNESIINGRMWKHIIIQSLCQIILLVKFCYNDYPGEDVDHIVYGTDIKWPRTGRLVHANKLFCGKYTYKLNLKEAYKEYVNSNCATVHMSLIFNIFVFYTLFNQINCRVIDDSFNILVRITRSFLFPLICLCEIGLQVLIIYIGKSPFHIVNEGFTGKQWGICIGFSAVTFVVSFLVKLIPIHIIIDKFIGPAEVKEEENKNDISEKTEKEKNEDKISNGAEKNAFKKENNWDSERSQKEIIYKKEDN
jgi:magnesium-transporting ATPase (P-type)